jgi:cytoskeletal protein CcmA (bactofilin family)
MSGVFGDDEGLLGSPGGTTDNPFVAQLGRISGKLLAANLLRNGNDLAFRNQPNDIDLLYFDVNNKRIGINNDAPVYDLDVNSTARTTNLLTPSTAFIANFVFDTPASSITPTVGDTVITPLQADPRILFNRIITDSLDFNNNVIASFNGENIVFSPSGSGTVNLQANTNVTGDLTVTGNITVDGDLKTISNLIIGDQTTDTVSIAAKFGTGLIPTLDATFDLGEEDFQWRDLYGTVVAVDDDFSVGNFSISPLGNISVPSGSITITPSDPNPTVFVEEFNTSGLNFNGHVISSIGDQDIVLLASGTGTIDLNGNTNVTGDLSVSNNLTVSGDLELPYNVTLGNGVDSEIIVNASVQGDLIPSQDNFYDIGTSNLRWASIFAYTASVPTSVTAADFLISAQGDITNSTGSIIVDILGTNPTAFFNRIENSDLFFDGNLISSFNDADIELDAGGSINLLANTKLFGDLTVSGDINLDGNLSTTSNIIIGDELADVVIINTDFTQEINPGLDLTYNLGSPEKRWSELYIDSTSVIENYAIAGSVTVNNLLVIDGANTNIAATQAGTDLNLSPGSGITVIERLQFEDNTITNLEDTPLTLSATGIGYYRFSGDNGIVLPQGDTDSRPQTPEIGDTRWNTELGFLECFDGNIYQIATGPSNVATAEFMEDAINSFALILG